MIQVNRRWKLNKYVVRIPDDLCGCTFLKEIKQIPDYWCGSWAEQSYFIENRILKRDEVTSYLRSLENIISSQVSKLTSNVRSQVDLNTSGNVMEWHFISRIFLTKTHNPKLIMRKISMNLNYRKFYKLPD